MSSFVNRERELKIVEDAFNDLLNKERLLQMPIIDFYGIEGVGKTTLLQQVVQKCSEKQIPHIWADVNQNQHTLEQSMISQAARYAIVAPSETGASLQAVIHQTKSLLEHGPLVLLFDSIDTTNESQLHWLESILNLLVVYNNLFVILSSMRSVSFEKEKSIARKLKPVPVGPLDWSSSEAYLDTFHSPLTQEARELVLVWTRGYPLAMNVMIELMKPGIDFTSLQGQQQLIHAMVERVLREGLLKKVKLEEHDWLTRAVKLLSIPRRFNLVIMQKLIEAFEPDLRQGKSLSYLVLLRWITQATEALSWKMEKAGFAIEDPIRHILLVQWQIEQPGRYQEINRFLAALNTASGTGPGRTRYQREYLYHSVSSADTQQLPVLLQESIDTIIQESEETPDMLLTFVEEFEQDTELKDILGQHTPLIQHLLYQKLAQKMFLEYEQETNVAEKYRYLHAFFDYLVRDPQIQDIQQVLKDLLLQLLQTESARFLLALYDDLGQQHRFREALGPEFVVVREQIEQRISVEG